MTSRFVADSIVLLYFPIFRPPTGAMVTVICYTFCLLTFVATL